MKSCWHKCMWSNLTEFIMTITQSKVFLNTITDCWTHILDLVSQVLCFFPFFIFKILKTHSFTVAFIAGVKGGLPCVWTLNNPLSSQCQEVWLTGCWHGLELYCHLWNKHYFRAKYSWIYSLEVRKASASISGYSLLLVIQICHVFLKTHDSRGELTWDF